MTLGEARVPGNDSVHFNSQPIIVDDVSFLKLKHRGSGLIVLDTSGKVLSRFGRSSHYEGESAWYHDLAVDRAGNLYTGDILGNGIQKFRRTSGEFHR